MERKHVGLISIAISTGILSGIWEWLAVSLGLFS